MAYYLRKILDLKQWQSCECLDAEEIPADPLKDLSTKKCSLSIFKINDSEDNLEDILVELALMHGKEANGLHCFRLNDEDFGPLVPRQTPFPNAYIVSNSDYHYDLGCFNSQKMVDFLKTIWALREDRTLIKFKPQIQELIKKSLGADKINVSKLNDKQKVSIYF